MPRTTTQELHIGDCNNNNGHEPQFAVLHFFRGPHSSKGGPITKVRQQHPKNGDIGYWRLERGETCSCSGFANSFARCVLYRLLCCHRTYGILKGNKEVCAENQSSHAKKSKERENRES